MQIIIEETRLKETNISKSEPRYGLTTVCFFDNTYRAPRFYQTLLSVQQEIAAIAPFFRAHTKPHGTLIPIIQGQKLHETFNGMRTKVNFDGLERYLATVLERPIEVQVTSAAIQPDGNISLQLTASTEKVISNRRRYLSKTLNADRRHQNDGDQLFMVLGFFQMMPRADQLQEIVAILEKLTASLRDEPILIDRVHLVEFTHRTLEHYNVNFFKPFPDEQRYRRPAAAEISSIAKSLLYYGRAFRNLSALPVDTALARCLLVCIFACLDADKCLTLERIAAIVDYAIRRDTIGNNQQQFMSMTKCNKLYSDPAILNHIRAKI